MRHAEMVCDVAQVAGQGSLPRVCCVAVDLCLFFERKRGNKREGVGRSDGGVSRRLAAMERGGRNRGDRRHRRTTTRSASGGKP